MTEKEVVLTAEGFQRLSDELEDLTTVKREEISERIKIAREFGDISENSEYNEAKNEQAKLEMRIEDLERKLRNAHVLTGDEIKTDVVGIGSEVKLKDEKTGKSHSFMVVGSAEADPVKNRISNESPIGKAIMDHKAKEVVTVQTPRGNTKYKIVSIKKG